MLNARQLVVPSVLCLALGACDQSPTVTPAVDPLHDGIGLGPGGSYSAPTTPRFGHTLGSGHRDDTGSTPAVASTETTAGDSTSVTEERGGHTLGSGH